MTTYVQLHQTSFKTVTFSLRPKPQYVELQERGRCLKCRIGDGTIGHGHYDAPQLCTFHSKRNEIAHKWIFYACAFLLFQINQQQALCVKRWGNRHVGLRLLLQYLCVHVCVSISSLQTN